MTLLYIENQRLKERYYQQKNINSQEGDKLSPPTETPFPTGEKFSKKREGVLYEIPKSMEPLSEKEQYRVYFDQVTPTSAYFITNDMYPIITIFDDTYTFTLQIPNEGFNEPFYSVPVISKVSTKLFGVVTRIHMGEKEGKIAYSYATDYTTNCTQHHPKAPACSTRQVYFYPERHPEKQIGVSVSCLSETMHASKCDALISSLFIDLP